MCKKVACERRILGVNMTVRGVITGILENREYQGR